MACALRRPRRATAPRDDAASYFEVLVCVHKSTSTSTSNSSNSVMVMVMVINSALVRTHQSTYSGSFGPVLPPGWIDYTRSAAVPLDVLWRGSPDLRSRRNANFAARE